MNQKRVTLALGQLFLLILRILAISFIIGSELDSISAPSLKNIPGEKFLKQNCIPNSLSPDYKYGAAVHFLREINTKNSSTIEVSYKLLCICNAQVSSLEIYNPVKILF